MLTLSLSCLFFLLTHLGISSTGLRPWLVSVVGESIYLVGYSILAFVPLGVMIHSYIHLDHNPDLWRITAAHQLIAKLIMPLALVFLVAGLMSKNPTGVKMEELVHEVTGYRMPGILKITRHPVQWGILLWAIAHLLGNSDLASLVFFCTFALLAFLGTIAMDLKHRDSQDPDWQAFYALTSNVPFAGLLAGKTRLAFGDVNWAAVIIGLTLYATVYYYHGLISGVSLM